MNRSLEDFAHIACDWFWETDAEHRFVYFSPRFVTVTGLPIDTFIGRRRDEISADRADDPKWRAHLDDLAACRPFRDLVYSSRRQNGELFWVRISGTPHFDASGAFLGYRGVGTDVTEEHDAKEALSRSLRELEEMNTALLAARAESEMRALHDALTGLPNRRFFERTMRALTDAPDGPVTLMHVDLDHFKQINDTLGHGAGDAVLKHVAETLRTTLRSGDFAARIGGDEFVILRRRGSEAEGVAMAGRLVAALSEPLELDGVQVRAGASVGLARRDALRGEDPADLLIDADLALYKAKRDGRRSVCVFRPQMRRDFNERRDLSEALIVGLNNGDFHPVFQPQFDLRTGAVVAVEALARWRHPTRGTLSPADFLPLAEELGAIDRLDGAILRSARSTLAEAAAAAGVAPPRLSVNVSGRRLLSAGLYEEIDEILREDGPPIAFELLETIFFDELETSMIEHRLDALRDRGIGIELDDFGSGRASITSLLRVRPDRLKIDRRLVAPLADDPTYQDLVGAIVQIARSLNISVVAEGVETIEHVCLLDQLGCDIGQGFALARPMSGRMLTETLRRGRPAQSA